MIKTRFLFLLLSAVFLLAMPVYAQRSYGKKPRTTLPKADNDLQQVQKLLSKEMKGYINLPLNEDYLLPVGLIERDVIVYYQLQDKYNSPLKLKMFKQSNEYKELVKNSCGSVLGFHK